MTAAAHDCAQLMGGSGYKLVPIPPGEKYPKGLGRWQSKATNDAGTLRTWLEDTDNGIGWVMGTQANGMRLIGVDVDVNDGKRGKQNLQELLKEWGPEVQVAFGSTVTARTGTGGYHFIFELPQDAPALTNGKLTEHVDTRGEGGFLVVAPTIHPNGQPYRWVTDKEPWTIDPVLAPYPLVEALSRMNEVPEPVIIEGGVIGFNVIELSAHRPGGDGESPADWARANLSINQMLHDSGWTYVEQRGTDAMWCRPGKNPKDGNSAIVHDDEHLVIFSTNAPAEFWRCGRDNADGSRSLSPIQVFAAIEHSGDVSRASSDIRRNKMPRPEPAAIPRTAGSTAEAPEGGVSGVDGTISPSDMNLPPEFWGSRDWLSKVRDAAHNRMLSPDAVLGALLARVAATIPVTYVIPPIVGARGTFDHLSVLVGESSAGKSAAAAVAEELFPERYTKTIVWDYPAPSGEGLIEAFFEFVEDPDNPKKKEKRQTKHAVHFTIEEAMALINQTQRSGTTIASVLCSAWAGQTIGQGNASEDRKRVLKKGRARVSGLMGIQSKLGHHFLTDDLVDQGLTGRIVWFAAEDPTIPYDNRPAFPTPIDSPHLAVITSGQVEFEYPEEVWETVSRAHWERATRNRVESAIDGHSRLAQLKLAGIAAAIEGRTVTTIDDWALAEAILVSSKAVRNHMQQLGFEARNRAIVTQGTAQGMREVAAEDVKERQSVARLSDSLVRRIERDGPMTKRTLARLTTSSSTRHRFDEALEQACDRGSLASNDEDVWKT